MTAVTVVELSSDEARALTDRIATAVEATWHLIAEAYTRRAWAALGYQSWDDYTTREFGTSRLRLPREERQEVVGSLRDAGLSMRAIASATGIDRKTVRNELAQVGENGPPAKPLERKTVTPNFKPGTVKGTDGKTYQAKPSNRPKQSRRKPLTDAAVAVALELRRSTERLVRLTEDDRWAANQKEVAARVRSHLTYTVQVCQDVLDQMGPSKENSNGK